MHQHGFRAAFFAKRAAELRHRRYSTVEGFETFAKTPRSVLESLDYPNTLSESLFGYFLLFMLSTFESEERFKDEPSRTLWNPNIIVDDEGRDKR